jgi:hypothetical protein
MTPRQAERVTELLTFCIHEEYRKYDPDSVVNKIVGYKARVDGNIKIMKALSKYRKKQRDRYNQSFFGGGSIFGAENDG